MNDQNKLKTLLNTVDDAYQIYFANPDNTGVCKNYDGRIQVDYGNFFERRERSLVEPVVHSVTIDSYVMPVNGRTISFKSVDQAIICAEEWVADQKRRAILDANPGVLTTSDIDGEIPLNVVMEISYAVATYLEAGPTRNQEEPWIIELPEGTQNHAELSEKLVRDSINSYLSVRKDKAWWGFDNGIDEVLVFEFEAKHFKEDLVVVRSRLEEFALGASGVPYCVVLDLGLGFSAVEAREMVVAVERDLQGMFDGAFAVPVCWFVVGSESPGGNGGPRGRG